MTKSVRSLAAFVGITTLILLAACGNNGSDRQAASSRAPSPAIANEKVSMKVASAFPLSLPLLGDSGVALTEKIERVSGGSIEMKMFDPGALVPALEAIPAVSKGSVDAAWSTAGYMAGTDLAFSFFSAVPFGPDAPEYLAWMYEGGGLELADELFGKHDVKFVPCLAISPEASGWFRKEITSLDDLKGMKIRFFGLGARVLDKLGVATQLLAGGDVFQALQLGTIDATEYSSPVIDESVSFYQVAKYYYFPGWHQPASLSGLFVNQEFWSGMSDQHRAMIEYACGDLVRQSLARSEAEQSPALRRMVDKHDVKIMYWPQEFLDAYEKAWREVVAEESQNNANFKKIYASYSKFREEFKLWGQNGYLKR